MKNNKNKNIRPVVIKFSKSLKYKRLLAGSPQTQGMRSGCVMLKKGESIGEHSTDSKEEAIIILQGNAKIFYSKNSWLRATKDSLVYIPANTLHNVKNIGGDLLRYVYVVSPVTNFNS